MLVETVSDATPMFFHIGMSFLTFGYYLKTGLISIAASVAQWMHTRYTRCRHEFKTHFGYFYKNILKFFLNTYI